MKFLLSLVFVSIISLGAFAQKTNGAKFTFTEETHDFGNVKEGPEATYDFVFKNTGNEPLIIQTCSASCGCTIPEWTKDPIMPGKSGKISVRYTTTGHPGSFNKIVYIQSNAISEKERYELVIKGVVIPEAKMNDNIKMSPNKQ